MKLTVNLAISMRSGIWSMKNTKTSTLKLRDTLACSKNVELVAIAIHIRSYTVEFYVNFQDMENRMMN